METIQGVLDTKGHDVWSIGADASVYAAIEMMATRHIGALLVMDGGAPVGMMSERDYARKVILKGRSSSDTRIKEIMTSHVYHTLPEEDVESCMLVMAKHHIRHLPVLADNNLVGMISLGDVVKQIIKQQQDKIKQLEHTITWQESY